jgi:hypothetical protein
MAAQFTNSLREQARYADAQRQQQFQNQLAQQQSARSDQQLDLMRSQEDRLGRQADLQQQQSDVAKQEMLRKVSKQKMELLAGIMSPVTDKSSYESARSAVKNMVDAGMLEPEFYSTMPKEYDKNKVEEQKRILRSVAGQPTYNAPAPIPGGRGAIGQTEVGSGKTTALVGQAPSPTGTGAETKLTKNQKLLEVERTYENLIRDYVDLETRLTRIGPDKDDPDYYRRLERKALQARQKDKDLVMGGKDPHFMDDLIEQAAKAEKAAQVDWTKVELPTGVKQDDVEHTAQVHKISVKEVLRRIGAKGEY